MPTVITVPIAFRTKSIKFGAAYSPALSFNPDKDLFYAMSGVLTGMGLTINTVPTPDEVTVAPGSFIQRGIIVNVTSAQVIQFPDPLPGVPIYLVAENANEVITSSVTIGFTTAPAADSVVIASWASPITTTVFEEPQKISILEIVNTLNGISKLVIKRHHIVASGGQTVFSVPSPFNDYVLGANKMWAFRNGQKLEQFLDYNETSVSSITLTFGALVGDEMELVTFKSAPPITSIALNDLTDVTTALADAIKDTGALRTNPATLTNFLATIDDVNAAVSAAAGLFTFVKYSGPVGSTYIAGGVPIPGTSVTFTLTAARPVKIEVTSGGFKHNASGSSGTAFIRLDLIDFTQIGHVEGSDGGDTLVETGQVGGWTIKTLLAGVHTAVVYGTGAGDAFIMGPIQLAVLTGEAI